MLVTGTTKGLQAWAMERSEAEPGQRLLRRERQDLLGGDRARVFFFIAFVGFENTQVVKGAVLSVSDLDQALICVG